MSDPCIPVFYLKPVKNNFKSSKEGRPIYEDREYVKILIPGSINEAPDRPVTDNDRDRWPEAYERFKNKKQQASEGTPLEVWPRMTAARVSELKDLNIFSVDQLATIPDSVLRNIGPDGHSLKQAAKEFLGGNNNALKEENERLRAEIERLNEENVRLAANQKKTPGRKRVA